MVDTLQTSPAPPVLDTPTGNLVLRIHGSSRDGQVVSLASQKCTVGSSPRCTLRLDTIGVRPIHCMIVRGEARTIVRRWAPDTRLNGRAFTDADLVSGDRLSIGPIEFDVLEAASAPETIDTNHVQPPTVAGEHPDLDELTAQLAFTKKHGHGRAKRLIDELRTARKRVTELDAQKQSATEHPDDLEDRRQAFQHEREQWEQQRNESEDQSRQRSEELDSQRHAFEEEQRQLNEQRKKTEAESSEHTHSIDAQLADVESQKQAVQQEREQWEQQRNESEDQSRQRSEELDARQNEIDSQRHTFEEEQREQAETESSEHTHSIDTQLADIESQKQTVQHEREQWEQQRNESEDQSRQRSEELDAKQRDVALQQETVEEERHQLETDRASLDEERQQWVSERDSFETNEPAVEPNVENNTEKDANFSEPSDESPVNTSELFDRLGVQPQEEDQEEEQDTQQPLPQQDSHDEGDDSIDSYMAQLLNRVRNITDDTKPSTPQYESRRAPSKTTPQPDSQTANSLPQFKPPKQSEAVDMAPRAVAPEKTADLNVLRELANVSADSAINTHSKKLLSQTVRGKLVVAIVSALTGLVLLWLWWSFDIGDLAYYTALAGFLIAGFWSIQYFILKRRLVIGRSKQIDETEDDPSTETSSVDETQDEKPHTAELTEDESD